MTSININLLPEEFRETRSGGSSGGGGASFDPGAIVPIGIGAAAAAVVIALPIAFSSIYVAPRQAAADEASAAVDADIAKYQVTLNELKGIADNKEYLRAQLTTLQNVAGAGASWGDILNDMRSQTPANVWFTSLHSDPAKGTLTIEGSSLDYGSVAYFHRNLDHSDFFYEPVLSSTDVNEGGPVSTIKFTMNVKVRAAKATKTS